MERNAVIKRIQEPADWVNSLVVVKKPGGFLRICLDPRDLNKAIQREHYQLPAFDEIASRLTGATIFTKLDANKGYWKIPLDQQQTLRMAGIASYDYPMVYILRQKYLIRGLANSLKQWMLLKLIKITF